MPDLKIVPFEGEHTAPIRAVRDEVFISEQGISPEIEFDGQDTAAMHVLVAVNGEHVGTGRMLDDGHIGRIAILQDYRSRGLGGRVVQALVEEAARRGYPRVYLGAQKQAVDFYIKLGFAPFGNEFMEAGIVHLSMEKSLR